MLAWTVTAIAEAARVSSRTVQRVLANLSINNHARPPRLRKLGPPHKLTTAARNALAELVRKRPWLYQDEMAEFVWEEFGIRVNQCTISRHLKQMGLSSKTSRRVASRQIDELCTARRAEIAELR